MTKDSDIQFGRWLRKNAEKVYNGKAWVWQYKNQRYNTESLWYVYHKEQLNKVE